MTQTAEENAPGENRCSSQQCGVIASRMLSLMNVNADPCTDFYEFACGGLKKSRELSESDPDARVDDRLRTAMKYVDLAKGTSSVKRRFFKTFYSDCLEYEQKFNLQQRLEKAKEFLKTIGNFDSKTSNSDELTELLAKLFHHNSALLFEIILDVSEEGRNAPFTIKIVPPLPQHSLLEPANNINAKKCFLETKPAEKANVDLDELYINFTDCKGNDADLMGSIASVLTEMGAFENMTEYDQFQTTSTVEKLLRSSIFSSEQITDAAFSLNKLNKKYDTQTVEEIQNKYTMVNWEQLLKKVLNVKVNSSLINSHTKVQVYMKSYFDKLFEEISFNDDGANLPNAILAMFAHTLYRDLVLPKGDCDRPKMCLDTVKGLMDDTAATLYFSTFNETRPAYLKTKIEEVFSKEIKILMQKIVNSESINSESERKQLTDKIEQMKIEVGTSKDIVPIFYLTKENLEEDYFNKVILLLKRRRVRMYADFKAKKLPSLPPQIWTHFSLHTKTSPIAVYGLNTIVIPLGMLTTPYFFPLTPEYMNMGAIGSIMAHEIIHHFDATGIKYDSLGRRKENPIANYEYIFQDLSKRMGQAFSSPTSFKLENGGTATFELPKDLSTNEKFADFNALDLAFESYQEMRNMDIKRKYRAHAELPYVTNKWNKNFFLAHAQMFCTKKEFLDYRVALYESEHLPPPIRVNMAVANSHYFSEVFSCLKQNTNQ